MTTTMLNFELRHALLSRVKRLPCRPCSLRGSRQLVFPPNSHIYQHAAVSKAFCARRRQQRRRRRRWSLGLPGRQCGDGSGNGEHRRRRRQSGPHPAIPPAPGREQAPEEVHGQARVVRARCRARDEAHVCAGEYLMTTERGKKNAKGRRRCSMRASLSLLSPRTTNGKKKLH